MQGTLNEIDIRSILQLIELGQRTGELFVEAYPLPAGSPLSEDGEPASGPEGFAPTPELCPPDERFWLLFFVNGQIVYAADRTNSNLLRLRDYLHRYQAEEAMAGICEVPAASINPPEYACLWLLMENRILTPAQGRNIIESMVQETLFDLLSLHQGLFSFEMGPALAPQLTTLTMTSLVATIAQQVQQWKQLHPHIQFPSQCPAIGDRAQLHQALPDNVYKSLDRWADGKTSLRQLSRYLNRNLLTIAQAIYPYVQQGWIQMLDPVLPKTAALEDTSLQAVRDTPYKTPHIVCIDDDATIGKSVQYILEPQGYQATIAQDPLAALSQVFHIHPDLILCDIAMPELDGYEICAMLRSSTAFRRTPIIMLTGKESFIDRVRARKVGSTDYLTKPFGANELLMLVEKYIGSATPPKDAAPSGN